MREQADLIAAAAAHAGDPRGTPAGNAELTQEQFDVLRERGLHLCDVKIMPVLVPIAPPCPGNIPEEYRLQAEMVMMPCPVMGEQLVAPGLKRPVMLLPDGRMGVPRE